MEKHSELINILLKNRGIEKEEEIEKFLNPDYEKDLHDPFLMKDMEKACVRLFEAFESKEKIVIYADYDADGIPGAVILHDLFEKIGYKNYEVYIPMRNSEGYGLNLSAIKEFAEKKIQLLITVDLGITAVAEVAQAEVDGIDVIITDHHLPLRSLGEEGIASTILPKAYAILNPKIDNPDVLVGAGYPEKMLCGAGVVFKFVQAFVKKYGEYYKIKNGWEKWLLDMVAIATLADMVPLLGENRVLASFGMKVLRKSPRPGLQKLLSKMKIDQRYLAEDDITFMVTPRLNAASRMDDPLRAYELLSTRDEVEAGALSTHLSKINDERKLIVATIMRDVKKQFEKREIREVIVIGNPKWKVGVLGLVAGKILDEYNKTVFVWGKDENDLIKGSCRSNGSISVVEIMTQNSEHFLEFGGHELAGGFTIENEKIHFLEEKLSSSYDDITKLLEKDLLKSFDIEGDLSLVNMKNWKEIEKMAPFGLANPKPIFLFKNVKIENIKKFGKNGSGEHLEITFSDINKNKVNAISFFSNKDSFDAKIEENLSVNLSATFDLSRFRGKEELRLRIIDIMVG
ncbi:MAG: single-stranded-DNA-specific exonuclease RecJ [Candidatus Paceibacterota bacterium]